MNIDKVANFFNKIGKIAGIVIASLLVILLAIRLFVTDPQYYKDIKSERKEYKAKVDSIYSNQDSLNQRLMNLERGQIIFYDIISQTNESIQANNKKLDNLRRLYNEKIKSIDRYTVSDLDSFFRTRYKGYYD